jgi:hypothetical protein
MKIANNPRSRARTEAHSALAPKRTLIALLFVAFLAPGLWADQRKPLPAVEGKLVTTGGGCPVLKMRDREQTLSGKTPYVLHTLQDKRLDGREVRLEGTSKPDGSFEVQWIFTIRDGKVYRVRYFCKLCNIEALEPGPCACCQQPTELDEVPVDASSP